MDTTKTPRTPSKLWQYAIGAVVVLQPSGARAQVVDQLPETLQTVVACEERLGVFATSTPFTCDDEAAARPLTNAEALALVGAMLGGAS